MPCPGFSARSFEGPKYCCWDALVFATWGSAGEFDATEEICWGRSWPDESVGEICVNITKITKRYSSIYGQSNARAPLTRPLLCPHFPVTTTASHLCWINFSCSACVHRWRILQSTPSQSLPFAFSTSFASFIFAPALGEGPLELGRVHWRLVSSEGTVQQTTHLKKITISISRSMLKFFGESLLDETQCSDKLWLIVKR